MRARDIALIESSWQRHRKTKPEFVVPAIMAAIVAAGFDEETAEREALTVFAQFWERTEDKQQ